MLPVPGGLIYLPPNPIVEATGDGPAKRAQRANRAYGQVVTERNRVERDQVKRILAQLQTLKTSLSARLLGSVTDFRRYSLQALLRDVDREIEQATLALEQNARKGYDDMASLGEQAADEPIRAAQLRVTPGLPGVDAGLVSTAFDNTVELLSQPMQQFASDIKIALRQVALAGDNKMEAIQKLRDRIAGAGFDNAEFRAERIIRTELGRVFEQANYDRLATLSDTFKFLRKFWRATGDNRTRLGHVEAAKTYGRGSGIPVRSRFPINVYNERPGKPAKFLGVAELRFPIDPQATPAGKLAAGATILCRCGAVVDFDLADFAEYTSQQVQLALGGVKPPVAGGPVPVPAAPPAPKPKPTRRPVTKTTAPLQDVGPGGMPVSAALKFDVTPNRYLKKGPMTAALIAKVKKALGVLDGVHGDGDLPQIPVVKLRASRARRGTEAYYSRAMLDGRPIELSYGAKALGKTPYNTIFHEVGHFLDHAGFEPNDLMNMSSDVSPLFEHWRQTVRESAAIKSMQSWRQNTPGEGITPLGVSVKQIDYMLKVPEVWARAYAQYVMVKSGDPAVLKELRRMQQASTVGPVDRARIFSGRTPNATAGSSWGYPWVWSDDDFKPIEAAIDNIMESKQWRKRK